MPLPPSRRDPTGPPRKEDGVDLTPAMRQQRSYLRSLDPGYLDGRFATPQPVPQGRTELVGGGDSGGGEVSVYEWEWNDRAEVIGSGSQSVFLTHVPIEESLFVMWHPNGVSFGNGVPITSEYLAVQDDQVIIANPGGTMNEGDWLSFQYQFDPDLMGEGGGE